MRLEVWDCGGQARFDNLTPMYDSALNANLGRVKYADGGYNLIRYIQEADGMIVVYDVCSKETFVRAFW